MFEKVNPCHPDKVADRIAGAIVDLAYKKEKNPKIAVEVLIGHGICNVIAETSINITYDMVKENANSETTTGEWLDQTIQVNFKTLNNNFRESRAELNAKYYVKGNASAYTLRVGSDYYKEIAPIMDGSMKNSFKVAAPDGTLLLHSTPYVLKNFSVYQATFNISDLNLGGVGGLQPKDGTTIYVHLGTEELSTGSIEALKPTEVIKGLDINVTKLFDLY